MKALNYTSEYLKSISLSEPQQRPHSMRQYHILCRVIKQKHIKKVEFYALIYALYGYTSYRQMSYEEMYQIINIINHKQQKSKENFYEKINFEYF